MKIVVAAPMTTLPISRIAEKIGVANQRPRACVPTVPAVGGPGSRRTQRSESDMPIVPLCPDSTPPIPLSECIAELAEALGIEVA